MQFNKKPLAAWNEHYLVDGWKVQAGLYNRVLYV